MAAELEERCPICLDSCEEPSFVMTCLHRFCYPCILRWAQSKPECPLCKRRVLSIVHSVRADDDYKEHAITPPVIVCQAGGAPRHPHPPRDLHHPGAPQWWAAEGVLRRPVGGLQPPIWLDSFRQQPGLFQILQSWVRQELEETFGSRVQERAAVQAGAMGWLPGGSLQNRTAMFMQQRARVAVRWRRGEARRPLGWQDASPAGGQEGSPAGVPQPAASRGGAPAPGPAPSSSPGRPSLDELPGTSPAAVGGSPPAAPVTTLAEQEEPHEEPPTSSQGSEHSPGGPRRPPKRRAGSSKASPANKRAAQPR